MRPYSETQSSNLHRKQRYSIKARLSMRHCSWTDQGVLILGQRRGGQHTFKRDDFSQHLEDGWEKLLSTKAQSSWSQPYGKPRNYHPPGTWFGSGGQISFHCGNPGKLSPAIAYAVRVRRSPRHFLTSARNLYNWQSFFSACIILMFIHLHHDYWRQQRVPMPDLSESRLRPCPKKRPTMYSRRVSNYYKLLRS